MPRTQSFLRMAEAKPCAFALRFRFEGEEEVFIRRDEKTGDVILSRRPASWDEFFSLREEALKGRSACVRGLPLPNAKMNRHRTASVRTMNARYLLDTSACQLRHHEKSLASITISPKCPWRRSASSTVTEAELRYGLARRPSPALQTTIDTFLLAGNGVPVGFGSDTPYGDLRAGT